MADSRSSKLKRVAGRALNTAGNLGGELGGVQFDSTSVWGDLGEMLGNKVRRRNDARRLAQRQKSENAKDIGKSVAATVNDPQGPILKTNKEILRRMQLMDSNVKGIRDDTKYLRKKLDKDLKKIKQILEDGTALGGGGSGFFNTAGNVVKGALNSPAGIIGGAAAGGAIGSKLLSKFLNGLRIAGKASVYSGAVVMVLYSFIEPLLLSLAGQPDAVVKRALIGAIGNALGTVMGMQLGLVAGGSVGGPLGAAIGIVGGGILGFMTGNSAKHVAEDIYDAIMNGADIEAYLKKLWVPTAAGPAHRARLNRGENRTKRQQKLLSNPVPELGLPSTYNPNLYRSFPKPHGRALKDDIVTPINKKITNSPRKNPVRGGKFTYTPPSPRESLMRQMREAGREADKDKGWFDWMWGPTPKKPAPVQNRPIVNGVRPEGPIGSMPIGPKRTQDFKVPQRTPEQVKRFKNKIKAKKISWSPNYQERMDKEAKQASKGLYYDGRQANYETDAFGNLKPTFQGTPRGRIFNGVESAMGSYLVDQRWDQMPSTYGGRYGSGGGMGGGAGGRIPGGGFSKNGAGEWDDVPKGGTKAALLSPEAKMQIEQLSSGKPVYNSSFLNQLSDAELNDLGISKAQITSPENRGRSATMYSLSAPKVGQEDINAAMTGSKNKIVNDLMQRGFTSKQASAIYGNITAESSGNPAIVNSIGATGYMQWLGERKTGLKNYAASIGKDWSDHSVQMDYIKLESTGESVKYGGSNEKAAYEKALSGDKSERQMAADFGKYVERPADWELSSSLDRRMDAASEGFSTLGKVEGPNAARTYQMAREKATEIARAKQAGRISEVLAGKGGFTTGQQNYTSMGGFGENRVIQNQQKVAGVRKGELKGSLVDQLNYAANKNGVYVEVFSGGQRMDGAEGATGSHRHDDGGAADFKMYKMVNGKKVYLDSSNPEHHSTIYNVTRDAAAAGVDGVGAGYMLSGGSIDNTKFHFGGKNHEGEAPIAYSGPEYFKQAFAEGQKIRKEGFDFRKEMEAAAQQQKTTGGKAGAAAFMGGLNSSMFNTMSGFNNKAKEEGIPTVMTSTTMGYSSQEYKEVAKSLVEKWKAGGSKGPIVVSGHSYGGIGAIRVAEELKNLGIKDGVQLNLIDPVAYNDFTSKIPDNVSVANVIRPAGTWKSGFLPEISASDPDKTKVNIIGSGGDHVGAAYTKEAQRAVNQSLMNTGQGPTIQAAKEMEAQTPSATIQQNQQAEENKNIVPIPTPAPREEAKPAGTPVTATDPDSRAPRSQKVSPTGTNIPNITTNDNRQEPAPPSQQRYNQQNRNKPPEYTKTPVGVANEPTWI